jgi:hypothetical protein
MENLEEFAGSSVIPGFHAVQHVAEKPFQVVRNIVKSPL